MALLAPPPVGTALERAITRNLLWDAQLHPSLPGAGNSLCEMRMRQLRCVSRLLLALKQTEAGVPRSYVTSQAEGLPDQSNAQADARTCLYTTRTHTCDLSTADIGQRVKISGWVQFQRFNRFLVLRDAYGEVQVSVDESDVVEDLPLESVLEVEGRVERRPAGQSNLGMKSGEVEVLAESVSVLSAPQSPPAFPLHDKAKVPNEKVRMEHRYLDIRRPDMQEVLRRRSEVNHALRRFLVEERGFVEVETPTMFLRTPGGAREFLVPSSNLPGRFYALTQSPQQFKQLLMVGGVDRYFQFARCYRDESTRQDRQVEFTQLDLEMSFPSKEGVMKLVEDLLESAIPEHVKPPFPRMKYEDAFEQYGTDKPDTRFESRIQDFSDQVRNCSLKALKERFIGGGEAAVARGLVFKRGTGYILPLDSLEKENTSVAFLSVRSPGAWKGILGRHVDADTKTHWTKTLGLMDGDLLLISVGDRSQVLKTLGRLRLEVAEAVDRARPSVPPLRDGSKKHFLWLTDFPLFERTEGGAWSSVHHPFTAPLEEDAERLFCDPGSVRAAHWDLVLNGEEVAGGSLRIHSGQVQKRVLEEILKEDPLQLKHLLEALDSGCPPHGGIALGMDRLYACLLSRSSIRDVIAFPKSATGRDPMSGAPAPLNVGADVSTVNGAIPVMDAVEIKADEWISELRLEKKIRDCKQTRIPTESLSVYANWQEAFCLPSIPPTLPVDVLEETTGGEERMDWVEVCL
ncbi:unnamed protein product [Cyprideis torosa]|uniref:Uncharacterized protein n=1 Tax=Cyprideis torosa TaxID=163714 RepID=A0A7R8ZKD2_9CRUS|nr:unnamed protein product [Cyprideis torosa]CAG0890633.1 unnamed protein product [Cyprideis torosa]